MTIKQALESAIEAMETSIVVDKYGALKLPAIRKCKSALAELDKCEPVGYANKNDIKFNVNYIILKKKSNDLYDVAVYTAPQPREWVGLTDVEISKAFSETYREVNSKFAFAKAIGAKLRELNTKG